MLRDSAVVIVVRTHPRAIPPANVRAPMSVVLRLAALRVAGAPLLVYLGGVVASCYVGFWIQRSVAYAWI